MKSVRRVMIIAGEASGDLHGSGVVRELKRRQPELEIFGVGGDAMQREGMNLIYHIRELGFMGFVEVVKHLPFIKAMERSLEQIVRLKRPEVLVLIDYPGFNLRFARIAKRYGVNVVYYISPQVWAWHRSRVKKMHGVIDKMLVIFPFEVKFYHDEGIDAEFVGHPLLESLTVTLDRAAFVKRYGLDPEKKILGVLPGSRRQEIEQIFPEMLEGAKILARDRGMEVAVAVAPTLEEKYFRTMYDVAGVHLVKGATYEVMQHADFALVTSGTATLETALFQTPMFVVYKTSWLTYLIGRALVQVDSIGLVNIVAGKRIVPEFIQQAATGTRLAREASALLDDPVRIAEMKRQLAELRRHLGTAGASERVADSILAIGQPAH